MTSELPAAIAETSKTCDRAQHTIELMGGPVRIQMVTSCATLGDALAAGLGPGLLPVDETTGYAAPLDGETVRVAVQPGLVTRVRSLLGPNRTLLSGGTQVVATGTGQTAGLVCWHRERPQVTRLLLSDAGASGQRMAVRVVRAVAERVLLKAGWAPLHAACALLPRRGGILLLGSRGAGKTTTLLHLLAGRPPAALVANSALFVIENGQHYRARALPASVAIRSTMVRAFPPLGAALTTPLHAALPESDGAGASPSDERLLVNSADLARCLGTTVLPEVDISAIVVVDHREKAAPAWRGATASEARTLVESAYPEPWLPDTVYEIDRLDAPAALRLAHTRLLDRLAVTVPCAVLHPGDDPGGELQRGLDRLLA